MHRVPSLFSLMFEIHIGRLINLLVAETICFCYLIMHKIMSCFNVLSNLWESQFSMSLDKLTRTEPSLRYQYLILTPIKVYSRHYSTKILEETLHSSVLTATERERLGSQRKIAWGKWIYSNPHLATQDLWVTHNINVSIKCIVAIIQSTEIINVRVKWHKSKQ